MIRMNSTMMIVRLLICTTIFVPPYCLGFKTHHIHNLYDQGLVINSTNWYLKLNISDVNEEIQKVIERTQNRYRLEDKILSYISPLKLGSPIHGQLIDSMPSDEGRSGSRIAEIITDVARSLKNTYCLKHGLSDVQCAKDLTKVSLNGTILSEMCMSEYYNNNSCIGNDFEYRSTDGSCNNLKRKYLGKANTPYKRLLFPVYTDGVYEMPNIYENKLPNPRSLSTYFVKDENVTDHTKTMMMAYWGMFIGHDLSHTAVSTMGTENKFVSCCDDDKSVQYTMNKNIRSCKPIPIPDDDRFFKPKPHDCINYVRSRPAVRSDCTFGPMEQMNQATHYLDASMIYGTTEQRTSLLRSKSCGMMLENKDLMETFLPLESTDPYACQNSTNKCFRAGDIRANAYLPLSKLHILWLREHNRVAAELCSVKPEWTDDQLFRETRKIITASIQHITYNEWLPALLGVNYTKENGLGLEQRTTYDETADPTISNSFATAILPFTNSMITDYVGPYFLDFDGNINRHPAAYYLLSLQYNKPLTKSVLFSDEILRGLVTDSAQKVDMIFTQTITNYLYSMDANNSMGMDIVSLDIQRSRDHGIPSYTQFRKFCGLKEIENLQDLSEIMMEGSAERLLEQYKTWNDIDLLVGILLEKHVDDAMVGPTMRCIIREQFVRTRIADRHFYDIPGVFSEYQLEDIKQVSLSRILCDNAHAYKIQQRAFFKLAANEKYLICNETSIPETTYTSWFDEFKYSKK